MKAQASASIATVYCNYEKLTNKVSRIIDFVVTDESESPIIQKLRLNLQTPIKLSGDMNGPGHRFHVERPLSAFAYLRVYTLRTLGYSLNMAMSHVLQLASALYMFA